MKAHEDLLQPLGGQEEEAYYQEALRANSSLIAIRQTSDGRGKGMFAAKDIAAGQVILQEPPLVGEQHLASKDDAIVCSHCFRFLGSIELQVAWKLRHSGLLADGVIAQLQNGTLQLPHSEQIPLPTPIACRGMCDELYCSQQCSSTDWRDHHSLLCTGEASRSAKSSRTLQALRLVQHHAQETNDIFLLAAKVVACTLSRARSSLESKQADEEEEQDKEEGSACRKHTQGERWQIALRQAWQPFAAGWKASWWDAVATPDDIEDEPAFRQELKSLAAESLELLKAALFDHRFPALFSLELYGNIVGMFELNNLGIVVPSPLLRWVTIVEDAEERLNGPSTMAADVIAGSVIEALTAALDESSACEGTAFYALQSCINHSCRPNAATLKGEDDDNGSAIITAKHAIQAGSEITISYVEEELTLHERKKLLRDYGFICRCERCRSEAAYMEERK